MTKMKTKKAKHSRRYVIVDSNRERFKRFLSSTVYFCKTQAEIGKLYDDVSDDLTWITYTQKFTDELLKAVASRRAVRGRRTPRRRECVVTVASPRLQSVPTLHGLFSQIVGDSPGYRWLPKDELPEVLFDSSIDRSELFIAAAADPVTRTLSLVRGDCQTVVVPFSFFEPSGDGTKPDFSKVRVADFGRTVALGDYEASTDAILYEADRDYRKKVKLQRKVSENSFGASLERLRKQRRLKRHDFPSLSAKTIARIERNEIDKPHGATLQTIAERLGVLPGEIGDY
jgi:DNA-directed RNA polymerase subunit H (RpoH/RPB5)